MSGKASEVKDRTDHSPNKYNIQDVLQEWTALHLQRPRSQNTLPSSLYLDDKQNPCSTVLTE
jgi:hypothetical protein